MRRQVVSLVLLAALGIPGMAQAATLGALDQDGVNLRSGPGQSFPIAGVVARGQQLAVVGFEGDWVKVKAADGSIRYAANWVSVVQMSHNEVAWARTTDSDLRLRAQPEGAILTTLGNNERLQLLEMNGQWWRVRRSNGQEGWASRDFLRMESTSIEVVGPTTGGGNPPVTTPPGPTQPPTTPPAPPPPAAPAGSVPALGALPPSPTTRWGSFQVKALAKGPIYQGRSSLYFDWTGSIEIGESLTLLDSAEGWLKVATPRGEVGWAPGSQLAVSGNGLVWQVAEGSWAAGFASVAAPAPPAPAQGQEVRLVRDNDGLRLRATPTLTGAILDMLGQNVRLTVLERQGDWIKVRANEKVGWVWAEYTIPEGAPTPTAPTTPQPVVGRPSFKLTKVRDGVVQLAVANPNGVIGQPALQGSTLVVPLMTGMTGESGLAVGTAGVRAVRLSTTGISLDLARPADVKVVSQGPGTLMVELRSEVTGLALQEASDRSILKLALKGSLEPKLVEEATGNLAIVLPGAVLAPGVALPTGVTVTPTPDGLTVRTATKRAYALKRTAEGFELHLYKPGLAGKVILLDPGHGGFDPGAVFNGVSEKVVNLEVALRLRAALAAKGATLRMTRTTDTAVAPAEIRSASPELQPELLWRTRMANEGAVDLFLSIHHNSGSALATGAEAFYTSLTLNGSRSRLLANLTYQGIVAAGTAGRYVKDERFFVTRNTEAPGALIEIGYLSNPADAAKAKSAAFQEAVTAQLVKAIEQFYAERP